MFLYDKIINYDYCKIINLAYFKVWKQTFNKKLFTSEEMFAQMFTDKNITEPKDYKLYHTSLQLVQSPHIFTTCCYNLKVHKSENLFGSDFEFCTISLLVMLKY
jgi:hypothetical protein